MFALSITSAFFMRAITVVFTVMVLTKSPTSAVSPPVLYISTPLLRSIESTSSPPLMISAKTSPEILFLFLSIDDDIKIGPVAPTQSRSSVFMMMESWAMPFQTDKSPVSFQYKYAKDVFVPAPSACMMLQYSSSPPKMSGEILQKALGKRPLSSFSMAL